MEPPLHPFGNLEPSARKAIIAWLGKMQHFLQQEELRQSGKSGNLFPPLACNQYFFWNGPEKGFGLFYNLAILKREICLCESAEEFYRIFAPWDGGHRIRLGKKKLSELLFFIDAFSSPNVRLIERVGRLQESIPVMFETGDGRFRDRVITSTLSRNPIISSEKTLKELDAIVRMVVAASKQ